MKELSIEQKAKAYDIALDKIKMLLGTGNSCSRVELEYVFPELNEGGESKDERIKKAVISTFKPHCSFYGVSVDEVLAWFEKQGEQKSVDKVEPKFKVGDEIKTKNEESLIITRIDRWGYWSEDLFICNFDDADKWELVEQKLWSEEDEKYLKLAIDNFQTLGNSFLTTWLKSIKDRVQPQPKQEWSEEDEREVAVLKAYICSREWSDSHIDRALGIVDELVKKLKSIRPQFTWKPSEEQMEALKSSTYCQNEQMSKVLFGLYQDLKKLREE